MKTAAQVGKQQKEEVSVEKSFAVDTSFVLFFLARFARSPALL